jgi:hypothetical protein
MCTIHLELVEGENEGIYERQEELGEENANVQELSQQMKQAQHAIVQIYQEKKGLRIKLVEMTIEIPMS